MNINKINCPVNTVFTGQKIKNTNSQKSNMAQPADSVCFKGKTESVKTLMEKYSFKYLANINEMQEGFANLYKAVIKDKKIKTTPVFSVIDILYQRYGFRGFLHQLWKPNPGLEVKSIIEMTKENSVLSLAEKNNEPVFSLVNHGPYGFFNYLNENYDAKRHMSLVFSHPEVKDSKAEFFMDKSGELTFVNATRAIRYYNTTGTPKTETIKGDRVEITHYNEDGSEAFFKNLFFGGTQGADDLVL